MNKAGLPKNFLKLFEWLCKPDLFEELQGDLEEAFEENITLLGTSKARSIYRKEVIKMIRPSVLRYWQLPSRFNHIIMFKNYFKTALRSMKRNPMSSFINIFGLAVAIGICLVVYSFIDLDYSIDTHHENKDKVYLSTYFVDREGTTEQYGQSPSPLGEMLKEDFANIQKVCRIKDEGVILKYEDKVFHERVRYVDATFLEMLTFPLKSGQPSTLADINNVILSENMAIKYFGGDNPVGQNILMKFGENRSKTFTVSGVAEAFPKAHAISFDFLINFKNLSASNPDFDLHSWGELVTATLIQVEDPFDLHVINEGMKKYKTIQNEAQSDWAISSFEFVKLSDLHFKSREIRKDISHDNYLEGRVTLPIIAIFMLVLACFNYINIAIVSASKRLKEIGLRKVIGANRGKVAIQFLAENVFVTFFALILGLFLAAAIFIPWFIELSDIELELKLFHPNLWIFLVSLLLFTGLASGIYPAFYISRFDVVRIFKGSVQFGKKNTLTKVFLGAQLILACLGITGAVMYTQNTSFQGSRSWGYDQKEALYIEVPNRSAYEQLNVAISQNPNVLSISGSSQHLGKKVSRKVIHLPDREYEVSQIAVDANYLSTMGVKLITGRNFKNHHESDKNSVVVNELLIKNLDLEQPIGQVFQIDGERFEIIGVTEEFFSYNFYHSLRPTIFTISDPEDYRYLSVRVKDGSQKEMYKALQDEWALLFPEDPFQGGYQENVWGGFHEELGTMQKFMRAVAFIAVVLASLGLYGLVTLNVSGRIREFSIRKVLGARLENIASNIVKQYLLLSIVALIIGAPISYLLVKANLDMMFPHPMPMGYSGVIIAVLILISVLLAVISTQVRKVSRANPVDGLKVE